MSVPARVPRPELRYPNPILRLSCADRPGRPGDSACTAVRGETRDRLLLGSAPAAAPFHPRRPIGPFTEASSFRMLVIHWLVLSSPDGTSPSTVRASLGRRTRAGPAESDDRAAQVVLRELSRRRRARCPDHFHTALFYSRAFHYLDPEAEGRFLAIARRLSGVPLALASDAIREGCLVDRATGAPVPWPAAEQVIALRGRCPVSSAPPRTGRPETGIGRSSVRWSTGSLRRNLALRDPRKNLLASRFSRVVPSIPHPHPSHRREAETHPTRS